MINRIWKRTFYKIGVVLGFASLVFGYVLGSAGIGYYFFGNSPAGMTVGLVVWLLAFFVHFAYRESKREVEHENEELMRQLKEDYRK